ncbi:MAG: PIG-L deacetylase family protein [Acidimicrobiia bacterium]
MPTVAFVHAHPDDEAIFTGGTMRRLADAGVRVVLVVATGGELGSASEGGGDIADLGRHRLAETRRAADALGVAEVYALGYRDSGMAGDPANDAPGSLWRAPATGVAAALVGLLDDEPRLGAVVGYDSGGIYGHPDHVRVHQAVHMAADWLGITTVYDATVDREHLHFVETHLVEEALSDDLGLVRSRLGVPSVEVTTTVDVTGVLDVKRAAMAAHASQIPETTSAMLLPLHHFAEVYGVEWYVRMGAPGPLDELS